jgi:RNA polymerase sigma factor (sigma-70 family)
MYAELADTEIIAQVLKGDQHGFSQIVERYKNYVFTLVMRMLENREDAEEVAQDIFVKAYRSLADFRGDCKFSTWLYTIARTSALSFLRKKKLDTVSIENEKAGLQLENRESSFNSNMIEQKSKHAMLHDAIMLLNPDDAQVITLFYHGEQSLEEIGNVLGMETNAIKVKLHRARQRLKAKMEKHFVTEMNELRDG